MRSDTRFAGNGDRWIAYEVMGDGPFDILLQPTVGSLATHLAEPHLAAFIRRLASFARVIRYDRLGYGYSDPFSTEMPPTVEQWATDAIAVLDAAAVDRCALIGMDIVNSVGAIAVGALHSDRISSLVMFNPTPCPVRRSDWPYGITDEQAQRVTQAQEEERIAGTARDLPINYPSVADDRRFVEWLLGARLGAASPTVARAAVDVYFRTDVRALVPTLRMPTLIFNRTGAHSGFDQGISPHVQWIADHIEQARVVDITGADRSLWLGDTDLVLDEIERFVTGTRKSTVHEDRVFAALLFTDIVSSTEQAAEVGDRRWREILDRHDQLVRSELERFRGRWVNPTGDGLLAVFDGPARAVRCAESIATALQRDGIAIRAGIHAGEVEVRGEDVAGIAVNIARRVCDAGSSGEVLVSRTVTDLVAGSGLEFDDRGEHELKGVSGRWLLYAVSSGREAL